MEPAPLCPMCHAGDRSTPQTATKRSRARAELDADNEPDVRQLVRDYLGLSTEQQAAERHLYERCYATIWVRLYKITRRVFLASQNAMIENKSEKLLSFAIKY
jgi:hypothetical protein